MKFVAYYRVSTQKQGQSGLGLQAQRTAVLQFVKDPSLILSEFTDVESGKNNQRPELSKAIAFAHQHQVRLVIAKLDRLSRDAAFIFTLRDSRVDFVCCDMPDANMLTIGIFAVLAQHERELISQRTRSALQAKKARGEKMGNPQTMGPQVWEKGRAVRMLKAREAEANRRASGYIRTMREKEHLSYQAIADRLNQEGFRSSKGKEFKPMTVKRLYDRMGK